MLRFSPTSHTITVLTCSFKHPFYLYLLQSSYHVVFFDEKVSRAWIKTAYLHPFNNKDDFEEKITSKVCFT